MDHGNEWTFTALFLLTAGTMGYSHPSFIVKGNTWGMEKSK